MKKIYLKPKCDVIDIEITRILCGSSIEDVIPTPFEYGDIFN